jgi:hypothetical protein
MRTSRLKIARSAAARCSAEAGVLRQRFAREYAAVGTAYSWKAPVKIAVVGDILYQNLEPVSLACDGATGACYESPDCHNNWWRPAILQQCISRLAILAEFDNDSPNFYY